MTFLARFHPLFQCCKDTFRDRYRTFPKSRAYIMSSSLLCSFQVDSNMVYFHVLSLIRCEDIINKPDNFGSNMGSKMFIQALNKLIKHCPSFSILVAIDKQSQPWLTKLFFNVVINIKQFIKSNLSVTFQNYFCICFLCSFQSLEYLQDRLLNN